MKIVINRCLGFKSILKHHQGRFLTVYVNGDRFNGKIVKAGIIMSRVRLACQSKDVSVFNWNIKRVHKDYEQFVG